MWDGRRWARDETGAVMRHAKETVRAMYGKAQQMADEASREKLARHALASERAQRLEAMVRLAETEPSIIVTPQRFDADPWLLNVANGTLDLRTGKLRPHCRGDLLTRLAPVEYDPAARSLLFEAFLERVLDRNTALIEFVQRAFGYSLTGSVAERVLLILHGTGKNGKTTLLEVLRDVLGDYASQTSTDTLLVKRDAGISNDIARLKGVRFVSACETDEGKRLAEATVKQMTGGDTITARFLWAEFFEFRPEFKVWLATNHKPVINGTDDAIWDRIHLVPFTVRISERERDRDLPSKLRAELPGILRWAVEGCRGWQRDGLGVATAVEAATGNYRREMDVIAGFLEECCVVGPTAKAQATALYDAYRAWGGDLAQREFGARLRERGFERKHRETGWWWTGVGFLTHPDLPDPENGKSRSSTSHKEKPAGQGQQGSDGSALGRNGRPHASLASRSVVESWPAAVRSDFEERAAVLEHDAGLDREEAERRALEEILAQQGGA